MELASQTLSGKTTIVIIVSVMDKSISLMPLVKPLDSRLEPEQWVSGTPATSSATPSPQTPPDHATTS